LARLVLDRLSFGWESRRQGWILDLDEALAAAILDRLLHDAEVFAINRPSSRLKGRLDALKTPTSEDHHEAR
jgi:hypothetical protein